MIYVGGEGTRTPGHEDICATIGHNIMVNTTPHSYAVARSEKREREAREREKERKEKERNDRKRGKRMERSHLLSSSGT